MTLMLHAVNYAPKRAMKKGCKGTFFARSDRGLVRVHNEDQASITLNSSGDVLLVVADGMGGYKKGDFASKVVSDVLTKAFTNTHHFWNTYHIKSFFKKAIKDANKIIYEESKLDPNYENMGTTVVACIIHRNKIVTLNIGDSRIYFYQNNGLVQVSEDQTVARYLVNIGQISEEEALNHPKRHVLTNALGNLPSSNAHIRIFPYRGETVLLCSDGLYNIVEHDEISALLATNDNSEQKGEMLIKLANNRGGSDNIAVALWEAFDVKN